MNSDLIKIKNVLIEKNKIENLKKKYANNVLLKYKINIDKEEILDYYYTKQLYDDIAVKIIENKVNCLEYKIDPSDDVFGKILKIMSLNNIELRDHAISFFDYDGAFMFPNIKYKYMYYTLAVNKSIMHVIKGFLNSIENIIESKIIILLKNRVVSFLRQKSANDVDEILIRIWNNF